MRPLETKPWVVVQVMRDERSFFHELTVYMMMVCINERHVICGYYESYQYGLICSLIVGINNGDSS